MDATAQNIRVAAMNLLGMREHSAFELKQKLQRKFNHHPDIDSVIHLLIEQQLLSDRRFAESFILMRFRQGKGPILIVMELKSKGVDTELIDSCLDQVGLDWAHAARQLRTRKFGSAQPVNAQARARQIRYLQSRGFNSGDIRKAFAVTELANFD